MVPRSGPTTIRPGASVSSIASSSAMRIGLLTGTIGPSIAILIRSTCAASQVAETTGDGVRMRGDSDAPTG